MNRLLYSVLWHVGLPAIGARLLWRARRQPDYLSHLAERFGRAKLKPTSRIWVHAVSVGETRAAQPLVNALLARYPDHEILVTHMTPTGRETSASLWGQNSRVKSAYLPYDFPWAVRDFVERARPQIGLIMETEVWPNLMAATQHAGIPMLLVNARLSEKSALGYARMGALTRDAYASFSRVLAQTPEDAIRLEHCGAKDAMVVGNMKFDVAISPASIALGETFRTAAGGRPIVLAASTREGEEEEFLDAFARHAHADALLVLVPRHPQRFDEVAALVERRGLTLGRRSKGVAISPETRVWVGDSMGEMVAYYAMADVAIIGGSWQPLGGQNLIEACAVGVPVIVGPHTFNFADAAEKSIDAGAAMRCEDLDSAFKEVRTLLDAPDVRARMSAAGRNFAAANQGATDRTMAEIARFAM